MADHLGNVVGPVFPVLEAACMACNVHLSETRSYDHLEAAYMAGNGGYALVQPHAALEAAYMAGNAQ